MGNLNVGQRYTVKTRSSKGIGLRKEPKRNAQIIMTLPKGSEVKLASAETRTSNGRDWYNISYMHKNKEKIGWVACDYLEPQGKSTIGTISSDDVIVMTTVYDVQYNGGVTQYPQADLQSTPMSVNGGAVTFFVDPPSVDPRIMSSTNLSYWNTAAGKSPNGKQRYPIPKPNSPQLETQERSNVGKVSSKDVIVSINVTNVKFNGASQYSSATLQSIPASVNAGAVTYSQGDMNSSTSIKFWETAAGRDPTTGKQRYPIPIIKPE